MFGVLGTTPGSCSLNPDQLSKPRANFCCMGIDGSLQGLSISLDRILAQGLDGRWDGRKVGCLEFLPPHLGQVP